MPKRLRPDLGPVVPTAAVWRFADIEVDERRRELRRGGVLRAIEPKPLDLLLLLLRHPNQLVDKTRLVDVLWSGRAVGDTVIARCVGKLRQALGDDEQTLIKTVHGYGYRLMAEPESCSAEDDAASEARSEWVAGEAIPQRPQWRLERRLGGRLGETWLARHSATGERRVFKRADDEDGRQALRREVAVFLVLSELGDPRRLPMPRLHDWSLEAPPYFVEIEYCAHGSLLEQFATGGDARGAGIEPIAVLAAAAARLAALHAAGIVHGALTPARILLQDSAAGTPEALIAGFGDCRIDAGVLAKLGLADPGESRAAPAAEDRLYRAPELLAGEPPDAATDVYALGVMLYQVGVGDLQCPLALGWERGIDDEILREDIAASADMDPKRRLADAGEFGYRLRALAERRTHRRAERRAHAEARELRAQLTVARSRRRLLVAVAATLGIGVALSSMLYLEAKRARERAEVEVALSAEINRFMNVDLLGAADPYVAGGGRQVTISSVLDAAAAALPKRFSAHPEVGARLAVTLARAYRNLGLIEPARQLMETALARSRSALGEYVVDVRALKFEMAALDVVLARVDEAAVLLEDLRDHARQTLGPQHPETLRARKALAWIRYERGYFAEAEDEDEQLRNDMVLALPADDPLIWDINADLVEIYAETHRWADAETLVDRVIAHFQNTLDPGSARRYWPQLSKVYLLHMQERFDEAEALARSVQAEARTALGNNHPVVLACDMHLGTIRMRSGRPAEALDYFEAALGRYRTIFGEGHYLTRRAMNRVGEAKIYLGHPKEAQDILAEALRQSVVQLGEDHPHTLDIERLLAEADLAAGEATRAEARFRHVVALGPKRMPDYNNRIAWAWWGLGRATQALGRPQDAAAALTQAHGLFVRNFGESFSLARRTTEQLRKLASGPVIAAPAQASATESPAPAAI